MASLVSKEKMRFKSYWRELIENTERKDKFVWNVHNIKKQVLSDKYSQGVDDKDALLCGNELTFIGPIEIAKKRNYFSIIPIY